MFIHTYIPRELFLLFVCPDLALFSNTLIQIRPTKDIYAYNEGAPNRGPLKNHMIQFSA